MAKFTKSQAKSGISEDALIWQEVKKVLEKKGAEAAITRLNEIRTEQGVNKLFAANKLFAEIGGIRC